MARFRILTSPEPSEVGRALPLGQGETLLGRDPATAPLATPDPQISRRHLRLVPTADGWLLADEESANGTFVNGERVARHLLRPGDRVRVGETELLFEDAPAHEPRPASSAASAVPRPSSPRAAGPPRGRRATAALGTAGALLLLLCACGVGSAFHLTRGFTNLRLLPTILRSIASNGWAGRLNPAPPKESGAPALDLRPFPSVRITAPKNALDKPRAVRVAALDPAWGKVVRRAGLARREIPVAAFRVDAGMTDRELFPGEVTVSVDLAQRGVPKELWPYARIYHVDDQGRFTLMDASVNGPLVSCKARHNYIFAVFLGLGYGTCIAVITSAERKFEGEESWNSFASGDFKAYWPARLPPRNPAVFNPVNDELEALWKKYLAESVEIENQEGGLGLDPAGPPNPMLTAFARYQMDPRVRELAPKMKDPQWLEENFVPARVMNGLGVLERCYAYLTSKRWRGFQEPTFKVDILFRLQWPHGDSVLAMTTGSYILYPYIDLDYNRIPDREFDGAALDPAFDALHADCVHELFHALQKTYYTGNPAEYDWFLEATAVTLEGEALEDFQGVGYIAAKHPTDRPYWNAFFEPLDFGGGDELARRHHGYGASFFLEFLRDRYYKGEASRQFLPKLWKDFGSWSGGTLVSLRRSTSDSDDRLSADFREFCLGSTGSLLGAHREENRPDGAATLTPDRPAFAWPQGAPRPLSTHMLLLTLRQPPVLVKEKGPVEPPPPLLLVRAHTRESEGLYLYASQAGRDWVAVSSKDLSFAPMKEPKSGGYSAILQRIESYVQSPAGYSATVKATYPAVPGAFEPASQRVESAAVGLFSPPPPKVGKVTTTSTELVLDPSGLARSGQVVKYRFTAQAEDRKRKPYEVETAELKLVLDLKKVFGKEGPKPGDRFEVSYRERVKSDGEVWGPPSVPVTVEVEDPFSGTWKGTIVITTEKVSDAVEKFLVKLFGEGARSAVNRSGVVNASNEFTLVVTPHEGLFGFGKTDYDVAWANGASAHWKPWQAKGTGHVEGEALVLEISHPDGTVFTLTMKSAGKDRLDGTFIAGFWFFREAIGGTLRSTRAAPSR